MEPKYYGELLKCIDSEKNNNLNATKFEFNHDVRKGLNPSKFSITLKNYTKGISNMTHIAEGKMNEFIVKGPLGKGLNL